MQDLYVEDGLTPTTGYHNLANLLTGKTLQEGDVIDFVDNGVIDDANSGGEQGSPTFGALFISVGVTFQSWSGNTNKPMWNSPTELDIVGATYFYMYDLNVMGNHYGSSMTVINGNYAYTIIDPLMSCVDVDIQRCLFNDVNSPLFGIGLTRAKFINNVVYNCQGIGNDGANYAVDYPDFGIPVYTVPALQSFIVVNNSFVIGSNTAIIFSSTAHSPSMSSIIVLNNIIDTITDYFAWTINPATPVFNVIYDYNDVFNSSMNYYSLPPSQYIGTHSLSVDPKLTNTFQLLPNSPCIDAGLDTAINPLVPTKDIVYVSRPQKAHVDIGAYEFYVAPTTHAPTTHAPTTPAPIVDYKDIPADVNVVDFKISKISDPVMSDNFNNTILVFTGVANPENINVSLISYQYSLNNGATWLNMTAAAGSELTGLIFSPAGEDHNFVWAIKGDIGSSIYNIPIKIRFRAQATFGLDTVFTMYKQRTITIIKNVIIPETNVLPIFPADYSGVLGSSLIKKNFNI